MKVTVFTPELQEQEKRFSKEIEKKTKG